jgi:hypothetical protein
LRATRIVEEAHRGVGRRNRGQALPARQFGAQWRKTPAGSAYLREIGGQTMPYTWNEDDNVVFDQENVNSRDGASVR